MGLEERIGSEIEKGLSREVNAAARKHFSDVMKLLGFRIPFLIPDRLAMRFVLPKYPFTFGKRESMYPCEPRKGYGRVIHKSREEGIKEIQTTLGSVESEHSWLYIPGLKIWVDNTLELTEYSKPFDVDTDQYLLTFLSYICEEVEEVHTHPDTVVENLYQSGDAAYSEYFLIDGARPSGGDFTHHIQLRMRMRRACRYVSSVISHHGITSFEMTEAGMNASSHASAANYSDHQYDNPNQPIEEIQKVLQFIEQNCNVDGSVLDEAGEKIPGFKLSFEAFTQN